jgi:hypothetical protein
MVAIQRIHHDGEVVAFVVGDRAVMTLASPTTSSMLCEPSACTLSSSQLVSGLARTPIVPQRPTHARP